MEIITKAGKINGIEEKDHIEYRGIKFATAGRFEYAVPVTDFSEVKDRLTPDGSYDATYYGDVCTQKRIWYEHLENPTRMFYYKEFREDISFNYSEDCLYLNICTPLEPSDCPVIIFIHGGGFDSGSNYDSAIDGIALSKKGAVVVTIQYRVGVFGYLTDEKIKEEYGREGNFGQDDIFTAVKWVKDNIKDFGGDPENITLMGQSAGAISIQYLCLSKKCEGLFKHVIMMSGGGMFPKFALPRPAESTREYWLDVRNTAGAKTFEDFKNLDAKKIFDAIEIVKEKRKDGIYNTMPVIDGYLIEKPVDVLIKNPLKIDYMIGYTNNDMYAPVMAHIGHKFGKAVGAYLYYFDVDAPGGDGNAAFHSADIRYLLGTLKNSFRPYDEEDEKVSEYMMDRVIAFAKTGNPDNGGVKWENAGRKSLHVVKPVSEIKMSRPGWGKLINNMIKKGDPKYVEVSS